jgi:hypothetical protein
MRTRRDATLEDLRRAIETLPRHTRVAMLEGINANAIIVGAYATTDGVCPMLAAHRAGGRTAAISFARAWDRVAFRDGRAGRSRRATERELLILRSHLEASLLDDELGSGTLGQARREHEQLVARRPAEPVARPPRSPSTTPPRRRGARPGDPNRAQELHSRRGWAWTRIVRRHDDYERLLAHVREVTETETETETQSGRVGATA